MEWIDLLSCNNVWIGRGTVFRFPAGHPYEEIVDFMLIECHDSPSGFALIVSSGRKAGIPFLHLPKESRYQVKDMRAISTSWVKENWRKWIHKSDPRNVKMCHSHSVIDFQKENIVTSREEMHLDTESFMGKYLQLRSEMWEAFETLVKRGAIFPELLDVFYPFGENPPGLMVTIEGRSYFMAKELVSNPGYRLHEGTDIIVGTGLVTFIAHDDQSFELEPDITDTYWLAELLSKAEVGERD